MFSRVRRSAYATTRTFESQSMSLKNQLILIWLILFTCACGGGGGSSPAVSPQPPIRTSPSDSNNSTTTNTDTNSQAANPLNWDLSRVAPANAGASQDAVDAILNHIFTDAAVQSVLISKQGFTIGERYADGYDRDSYGTSWSVAKSFYSAAIGVAIDEGFIASVDIKVSNIINEWQDSDKADITLKQILQMRSGYDEAENIFFIEDQTEYAINSPLVNEPASQFKYSNANSQLFEPILSRATGLTAHQFLAEKILSPIGINSAEVGFWLDASGTNPMTYCCLDMRPDDFARFGLMMARNGRWQDQQIVSAAYVEQSLQANNFYGFQWWILNSAYWGGEPVPIEITAALGLGGQKIYLWSEQEIVIVVLTQYSHSGNQGYVLDTQGNNVNFPNTCSGRNNCQDSEGAEIPQFDQYQLISLIQALDSE